MPLMAFPCFACVIVSLSRPIREWPNVPRACASRSSRQGHRTRGVAIEPVRGCRRSAWAWTMGQAFELLRGQVRVQNGRLADPASAAAGGSGDMTGWEVVRSSRSGLIPRPGGVSCAILTTASSGEDSYKHVCAAPDPDGAPDRNRV